MVREYEGQVQFIGMAGRDSTGAMQEFVDRHGLAGIPHAVDTGGNLWAGFGVSYQPAWVFISPTGEVTRHFGPLNGSGLRSTLDDLLT